MNSELHTKSRFALVTGGSSGIGRAYAAALARDYGYDLLLVSNQLDALAQTKCEFESAYGVQVQTLCMNLSQPDAAEQLLAYCEQEQLDIHVLINNAGILIFDAFYNTPVAKIDVLLGLHVTTLTKLCRLFGERMIENGGGYILNMSSMSAWMAVPSIACYNASKAYVLNLTKALWYEFRARGVRVLAVTPGSTDTGLLPFPPSFGKLLRGLGITMSPERLVNRALKVLFTRRKKRCMPGAWNYIIVPIVEHLPDWLIFAVMKKLQMFAPQTK